MKTVAVLGASYGGTYAAQILSRELPDGWRVVLIDRNSHLNHLYVLPRYVVLPQHAHKAFVPYTHVFRGPPGSNREQTPNPQRSVLLHAQVTSLSEHSVTLSQGFPELGIDGDNPVLNFDYAVYALGSHLPAPINLWGPCKNEEGPILDRGTKAGGIEWLRKFHAIVEQAPSVLVVGGGALGIQYATDIAEVYPNKSVTLLHSRHTLLPRFSEAMHEEILSALESLDVKTILGERLDMSSLTKGADGQTTRTVRTQSGRELSAGIVLLCTGQTPNAALMQALLPDSIVLDGPSKGMIHVKRTLQVAIPGPDPTPQGADDDERGGVLNPPHAAEVNESDPDGADEDEEEEEDDAALSVPFPHLFAIGDVADAFGAINAGHTAAYQGETAARNIIQLIREAESHEGAPNGSVSAKLLRYKPGPPGIKISLGLSKSLYEVDGVVGKKSDVPDDLDAALMWKFYGIDTDEEGMHQ